MAERAAESFSQSTMIPEIYQGKPGNCMIALDTAYRLGISALMVMQNLYPVKGKPQWSGQFAIALINNSGKYSSTRYEWRTDAKGEKTGCRMIGTESKDGKEKEGAWITKEMVSAEGWGAKWRSMPEQMYMYRAAAFFSRAHCPEVTLGMYVEGEAEDIAEQAAPKTKKPLFDEKPETKPEPVRTRGEVVNDPPAEEEPPKPDVPVDRKIQLLEQIGLLCADNDITTLEINAFIKHQSEGKADNVELISVKNLEGIVRNWSKVVAWVNNGKAN